MRNMVLGYQNDGTEATFMALDRAIRCGNDNGESIYIERGLLIL